LANCQKAAEIDSKVTSVYVTLGRIHEISGKHDLAVQEFQRALDLDPRDAAALDGIAHSYESAGHIAEAEVAYKKAIALRPDDWNGYDELGLFYDHQERYPEAAQQLRQAITITPDNAQIYLNLGAVYSDSDDPKLFPEAEKALKRSLEINPSYAAYANLGNLYYMEKRYAESAAMTESALSLDRNDYRVWNNLIAAYKWLNEPAKVDAASKKMLELLEDVVKINPQDALARSLLATLYAKNKDRQRAVAAIETAQALSPKDPQVIENIGIAYEKLGNRTQSIKYISEALADGLALEDVKNDPDLQSLFSDPDFVHRKPTLDVGHN
jgi:tetratricopeptide (TPR) repeat protein